MNLLYHALQHLDTQEWTQLVRASESSYWNSQREITRLLQLIRPYFKCNKTPPEDQYLFPLIYPSESFSSSKWALLRSDTLILMEKIVIAENMLADQSSYRKHIINWYRNKGIKKNLTTQINRAHKDYQQRPLSIVHLHDIHQLELETYRHRAANRSLDNINIPRLLESADLAYVAQKMRLLCYSVSHQQVMAAEYSPQLVDAILCHIQENKWTKNPLIGAYYYSYLALVNEDDSAYQKLKQLLLDQHQQIDQSELKDITILAINFSIGKYRSGNKKFSQEVFEWYKFGIENGPLTSNQNISPYTYRNAATIALRMNNSNWAEAFTEKYKVYLDKKIQEELYKFNMARISYQRGDYFSARDFLWNVEFEDILLTLAHRTLQLKLYFLTEEYSLLDSTTDSFKAFLRRKKIAKSHSASYLKFANFMRLISRWKQYNPDKMEKQRQRILMKIDKEKDFPERQWFLDQLI